MTGSYKRASESNGQYLKGCMHADSDKIFWWDVPQIKQSLVKNTPVCHQGKLMNSTHGCNAKQGYRETN
jgi:hypothetical protein